MYRPIKSLFLFSSNKSQSPPNRQALGSKIIWIFVSFQYNIDQSPTEPQKIKKYIYYFGFQQEGNVAGLRPYHRENPSRSANVIAKIRPAILSDPIRSIRQLARRTKVFRSTVDRIFTDNLALFLFTRQLTQSLKRGDNIIFKNWAQLFLLIICCKFLHVFVWCKNFGFYFVRVVLSVESQFVGGKNLITNVHILGTWIWFWNWDSKILFKK